MPAAKAVGDSVAFFQKMYSVANIRIISDTCNTFLKKSSAETVDHLHRPPVSFHVLRLIDDHILRDYPHAANILPKTDTVQRPFSPRPGKIRL